LKKSSKLLKRPSSEYCATRSIRVEALRAQRGGEALRLGIIFPRLPAGGFDVAGNDERACLLSWFRREAAGRIKGELVAQRCFENLRLRALGVQLMFDTGHFKLRLPQLQWNLAALLD